MDPSQEIRPGLDGGIVWPSVLRPGLRRPESVCRRQAALDVDESKANRGVYCFLPTREATKPEWLEEHEINKIFRISKSTRAREEINWYYSQEAGTAVPWELLRLHIIETFSETEMRKKVDLQRSRLCGVCIPDMDVILLGHASGAARETPTLSVLTRSGSAVADIRCEAVRGADGTRHQIQEALFSAPLGAAGKHSRGAIPFLAIRSWYWISVYQPKVEESSLAPSAAREGAGQTVCDSPKTSALWQLDPVSSLQLPSRITHVSWSPRSSPEIAFACEDGSLGFTNILLGPGGEKGGLTARILKQAQEEGESEISCLEWADHPRLIYYSQAHELWRLCFPDSSKPPQLELLHARPRKDSIMAAKRPDRSSSLLALCTTQSVCLLDVSRPRDTVLRWKHDFERAPPPLVSFHLAEALGAGSGSEENSSPAAQDLVGCISLASLGSGYNLAFRFRVVRDGVRVRAHRPDSLSKAEGEAEPVGRITATPVHAVAAETASKEALDPSATEWTAASTGFSWVPRLCDRFYSLDMPQRMTVPLAERRAAEERSFLTSAEDEDVRELLASAPDIQGWAAIPGCQVGMGDSLLARMDLLGRIYVDQTALFRTTTPPSQLALPPRRVLLTCGGGCAAGGDAPLPVLAEGVLSSSQASQPGGPSAGGRAHEAMVGSVASPYQSRGRMAQPKGELAAILQLVEKCVKRWTNLEQKGEHELVSTEQLSSEEQGWVAEVLEHAQVPMTVAELERGVQFRASAAAAESKGFALARPTADPAAFTMTSAPSADILGGGKLAEWRMTTPHPKRKDPCNRDVRAELLYWPGAWQLAQLLKDSRRPTATLVQEIKAVVQELSVRVSQRMTSTKLPESLRRSSSTRQSAEPVQTAMDGLQISEQGMPPTWTQVPFHSSFGADVVLFPSKTEGGYLDLGIEPAEPESVEAKEALHELEEEWARREAEGAPGSAQQVPMKAGQPPDPQEDAAMQPGESLLAPLGAQPWGRRPERKRRKQVTEGFH